MKAICEIRKSFSYSGGTTPGWKSSGHLKTTAHLLYRPEVSCGHVVSGQAFPKGTDYTSPSLYSPQRVTVEHSHRQWEEVQWAQNEQGVRFCNLLNQ